MHLERIAELLRPFLASSANPCHSESSRRRGEEPASLSGAQLAHISTYVDILLHWNSRINLTAIRDPEEIVTRHFGESLFAARHLFPEICSAATSAPSLPRASTVADVGTGAGFPGIPIKLWAKEVILTLIESNQRKAVFLREVARALTLTDINIINARAQSLVPATYGVVTLRAVERFEMALPLAAALVAASGRLAILISSSQVAMAHSAVPISWEAPLPIPGSRSRVLLLGTANPGR
jgi:16S rRNA (guanine527-N7)-methyltransferase